MRRSGKITDEELIRFLALDLAEPTEEISLRRTRAEAETRPPSQCRHKTPVDKFVWGLDKGQTQKMELLIFV
jgi:hypothetical protein